MPDPHAPSAPSGPGRSALRAELRRERRARSAAEEAYGRIVRELEAVSSSFVLLDREWRFTFVNAAAEALLGRRREELLGRGLWDVFPGAVGSVFHREYHRAMREQVPVSFEAPSTLRPDLWLEVRAYPTPTGLSIHTHDVTERRRAEREREELLERERAARAEAEAAARARERVLHIVSHDLRNPLSAVTAHAELLLETLPPGAAERERRWVSTVRRAADQMNRLIGDLLEMTAVERERLTVRPLPARPALLAREALELLEPLARERGVELRAEVPDSLPPVYADPERVLQVLSNLVGNALAFTPAGGAVTVAAAEGAGAVRFSVADTGTGIPEEEIPRVFEPYWRGRRSGHAGTGLGLAISKGIVEAHGGAILCESRPGQGAAFHFTLPLATPLAAGPEVNREAQGAHR